MRRLTAITLGAVLMLGVLHTAVAAIELTIQPIPVRTDELVIAAASTSAPEATNFTWFVNGIPRQDLSGLAQNVAAFAAPGTPGTLRIGVVATAAGGATTSAESVVPLVLSETTRAFQQLVSQADEVILQQQEIASQLVIGLSTFPENPQPGETATLTVTSFQADLSKADISWFVNGRQILSGRGATAASVALAGPGTSAEIQVSVSLPDGREAAAERVITPAAVDFYWWADSYIPAWYPGKALPSPGSTIFIQARPSFPTGVAQSLIYTWTVNDETAPGASGPGRAVFSHTIPRDARTRDVIRVRIANASGTIRQEAAFAIPLVLPEVLFYELEPLAGINPARALDSVSRPTGKTVDLTAEPFFAPREALASLEYRWSVNGQHVPESSPKRQKILTLISDASARGAHEIELTIADLKNRLIEASQSMRLNLQ